MSSGDVGDMDSTLSCALILDNERGDMIALLDECVAVAVVGA
jgi:hypothetical protein